MAKIGILGGSFNPIHAGHMRMAVDARETVGLDRVLLLPVGEAPHKPQDGMLPFAHRLRLVELAVRGVNGLSASGMEGNRPGPSYTLDTLLALREKMPGDELWFILGSESFRSLAIWHRGLEIHGMCSLVVIVRAGDTVESLTEFARATWPGTGLVGEDELRLPSGTSLRFVHMPVLEVSSSDCRRRWSYEPSRGRVVPLGGEGQRARVGTAD